MTTRDELVTALDDAEATYRRHGRHLMRLNQYHDDCPDGDPRKVGVERDIARVSALMHEAERAATRAADALTTHEDETPAA